MKRLTQTNQRVTPEEFVEAMKIDMFDAQKYEGRDAICISNARWPRWVVGEVTEYGVLVEHGCGAKFGVIKGWDGLIGSCEVISAVVEPERGRYYFYPMLYNLMERLGIWKI